SVLARLRRLERQRHGNGAEPVSVLRGGGAARRCRSGPRRRRGLARRRGRAHAVPRRRRYLDVRGHDAQRAPAPSAAFGAGGTGRGLVDDPRVYSVGSTAVTSLQSWQLAPKARTRVFERAGWAPRTGRPRTLEDARAGLSMF